MPAISFSATGVHHGFGACYADAGTLKFQKTVTGKLGTPVSVQETMTFLATTPATGTVTLVIAGQTSSQTLPKYGTCPHA